MILVFGCPLLMTWYNCSCNSHQHGTDVEGNNGRCTGGRLAGLRSFLQVDLLYEMLLSIKKRDQSYQFRFAKLAETFLRGMPMAVTQMFVLWRMDNVLTSGQASTLTFSIFCSVVGVTLTYITFIEQCKPSVSFCFWCVYAYSAGCTSITQNVC